MRRSDKSGSVGLPRCTDIVRMTCQESGGDSKWNSWVREDESLGLRVVRRDRHTQVVAVVFRRRIGQLYGYHVITVFCTATDPDAWRVEQSLAQAGLDDATWQNTYFRIAGALCS